MSLPRMRRHQRHKPVPFLDINGGYPPVYLLNEGMLDDLRSDSALDDQWNGQSR